MLDAVSVRSLSRQAHHPNKETFSIELLKWADKKTQTFSIFSVASNDIFHSVVVVVFVEVPVFVCVYACVYVCVYSFVNHLDHRREHCNISASKLIILNFKINERSYFSYMHVCRPIHSIHLKLNFKENEFIIIIRLIWWWTCMLLPMKYILDRLDSNTIWFPFSTMEMINRK